MEPAGSIFHFHGYLRRRFRLALETTPGALPQRVSP